MPRASLSIVAISAAFAAGLASSPARAACTVTAVPVAFGTYDPQSAGNDDGVGTITVTCRIPDPAPNVALSTGGSGTYSPRRMTNGAWTLDYNLYTTAARVIVWGDGTGGTQTVNPPGVLSPPNRIYTATVYGRIPALQNVGAGNYGDTITVTVTW